VTTAIECLQIGDNLNMLYNVGYCSSVFPTFSNKKRLHVPNNNYVHTV